MKYYGNRRRRKMRIPRYITPDTKLVKLRYHLTYNINSGQGETAWLPIGANDICNPSYGAGAHKPLGFNQMMDLYERFCVVGSKINVCMAEQANPSILGVAVRNNNTAESVQHPTASKPNEGLLERNRTVWKYCTSAGTLAPQVNQKFSTKKFFHVKSVNDQAGNLLDEGTLWGNATSSPTTKAYFNVFAATISPAGNSNYHFRITVSYTVLLAGRKLLAQS